MKRLAVLVGCAFLLASPALATNEFNKEWKEIYLNDKAHADFTPAARKAGCNVCHIKGEKKTEHNEYGLAVKEYLSKEKLTKEWVEANPEEAKKIMAEGLKKAAEKSSKDGEKFGKKIADGKLPATDAGL